VSRQGALAAHLRQFAARALDFLSASLDISVPEFICHALERSVRGPLAADAYIWRLFLGCLEEHVVEEQHHERRGTRARLAAQGHRPVVGRKGLDAAENLVRGHWACKSAKPGLQTVCFPQESLFIEFRYRGADESVPFQLPPEPGMRLGILLC
jgi:hypothetical protein